MDCKKASELFEMLVNGHELSADGLESLIKNQIREDLHLDYKHGNLLKGEKSGGIIRKYVSAFANSEGGILIIGVEEKNSVPLKITGCQGNSKGRLDEWASRCLSGIASYLSPPPRFQVVNHPKGDVLICVVQRSLLLVPVVEEGKTVYYFRLHDQALKAPDYFMADLLLGRRQQPIFEIEECKALNFQYGEDKNEFLFDVRFRVENASLVWADESQWGIIVKANRKEIHPLMNWGKPGLHLLSFLEVKEQVLDASCSGELVHYFGQMTLSKPFDMSSVLISVIMPLRVEKNWLSYTWKAAIYFVARNSLPIWYQITVVIDPSKLNIVERGIKEIPFPHEWFRIEKLTTERPVVGWVDNIN